MPVAVDKPTFEDDDLDLSDDDIQDEKDAPAGRPGVWMGDMGDELFDDDTLEQADKILDTELEDCIQLAPDDMFAGYDGDDDESAGTDVADFEEDQGAEPAGNVTTADDDEDLDLDEDDLQEMFRDLHESNKVDDLDW